MRKILSATILLSFISGSVFAEDLTPTGNTTSTPATITAKVHEKITMKANYTFHLCNSANYTIRAFCNSYLKDNQGHLNYRQDVINVGRGACYDLNTYLSLTQQYDTAGQRQLIASADIADLGLRSENSVPINIVY